MNLVHASDGEEAAARELKLYFDDSEFCDYDPIVTPFLKAGDE
jgi:nucleoside-diphosphate kinase